MKMKETVKMKKYQVDRREMITEVIEAENVDEAMRKFNDSPHVVSDVNVCVCEVEDSESV